MHKTYTIVFFFSVALTSMAVLAFVVFGLNLGVDFKGGSFLELEFKNGKPHMEEIKKALNDNIPGIKDINFVEEAEGNLIMKTSQLSEQDHQAIVDILKSKFSSNELVEKRFDSVGPVVGQELKQKSMTAIIIVLIAVIIYIAFVFRKMSVVLSPWAMSVAAIMALFHDVIIPVGVFAVLGHYYNVEISAVFVAAILTILGYSVSDTVVVFDRVRENVIRNRVKDDFGKLVHLSIMQTLTRSLNTTFTTLLSLIAIYAFGGESLRYFALALIIGILSGAYSSIFVASPILVWWSKRFKSR